MIDTAEPVVVGKAEPAAVDTADIVLVVADRPDMHPPKMKEAPRAELADREVYRADIAVAAHLMDLACFVLSIPVNA